MQKISTDFSIVKSLANGATDFVNRPQTNYITDNSFNDVYEFTLMNYIIVREIIDIVNDDLEMEDFAMLMGLKDRLFFKIYTRMNENGDAILIRILYKSESTSVYLPARRINKFLTINNIESDIKNVFDFKKRRKQIPNESKNLIVRIY